MSSSKIETDQSEVLEIEGSDDQEPNKKIRTRETASISSTIAQKAAVVIMGGIAVSGCIGGCYACASVSKILGGDELDDDTMHSYYAQVRKMNSTSDPVVVDLSGINNPKRSAKRQLFQIGTAAKVDELSNEELINVDVNLGDVTRWDKKYLEEIVEAASSANTARYINMIYVEGFNNELAEALTCERCENVSVESDIRRSFINMDNVARVYREGDVLSLSFVNVGSNFTITPSLASALVSHSQRHGNSLLILDNIGNVDDESLEHIAKHNGSNNKKVKIMIKGDDDGSKYYLDVALRYPLYAEGTSSAVFYKAVDKKYEDSLKCVGDGLDFEELRKLSLKAVIELLSDGDSRKAYSLHKMFSEVIRVALLEGKDVKLTQSKEKAIELLAEGDKRIIEQMRNTFLNDGQSFSPDQIAVYNKLKQGMLKETYGASEELVLFIKSKGREIAFSGE